MLSKAPDGLEGSLRDGGVVFGNALVDALNVSTSPFVDYLDPVRVGVMYDMDRAREGGMPGSSDPNSSSSSVRAYTSSSTASCSLEIACKMRDSASEPTNCAGCADGTEARWARSTKGSALVPAPPRDGAEEPADKTTGKCAPVS